MHSLNRMLPDELAALRAADAYPHPCSDIEVVETHISWVILTGDLAYKLKRPVKFPFVDFSTLERRAHFCQEELRCNRSFAPSLYLDVVPVTRSGGGLSVGAAEGAAGDVPEGGEVVEWAVKMRQFPPDAQLDRLLARGGLSVEMLTGFGETLAGQHAALPVHHADGAELQSRVLGPAEDNYRDVTAQPWTAPHQALLERSRAGMARQVTRHRELMLRRLTTGWLRECHGDLHLSNLVLLDSGVTAFDCLEFNATLRWIDPVSDVAFLFMDCLVRERPDLAYGFLDGYLDAAGDYEGVTLLPFYAGYRSMVRAKVAALRRSQTGSADHDPGQRFLSHLTWSADWLDRAPGSLILTCGLSGSGKSYLAQRLAPRVPAVRLRSDVARKVRAGLDPQERAGAAVGKGLYQAAASETVYEWLLELGADLLASGEHVIVDATFLEPERRSSFLAMARKAGAGAVILHCQAPDAVLEERVRSRVEGGGGASDADLAVLAHQRRIQAPPQERTVAVDTSRILDADDLEALADRLLETAAAP